MAQVTKRTTTRGPRYDVRTRIGGRVVTKTFRTEREARTYARLVEADRVLGVAVDPHAGGVPFGDYFAGWLVTRPLAVGTVELYERLYAIHLAPTFASTRLNRLAPEAVRRWHAEHTRTAPGPTAKAYRLLRAVMNTALAEGLIGRNPCNLPGGGVERSAERPLVPPGVVLDLADAIEARYRALVLLAGFGGLRLGELLALERRHVDPLRATVTVAAQAIELRSGERVVTPPKSHAGRRTVALPALVVEALDEHLAIYVGPEPGALLFTGPNGGPLRRGTLQSAWDRARRSTGRPELHLHDLRHAAGTLAAQAGATLREVMARIGHSTPRAALLYQHAAEDRDRVLADRLDELARAAERPSLAPVVSLPRDGRAMEAG